MIIINLNNYWFGRNSMLIVITSQNRHHITPHAGKCRKFWKYELKDEKVTDKQLIEVEKEESFSQSGEVLEKLLPMDIFVTTGIGDRLREKLRNIGVHVIVTTEIEPEQFICSLDSTK